MLDDGVTIVCGIRTPEELEACVREALFDRYVWVNRLGVGQGPTDKLDLAAVGRITGKAVYCILNNGTLDDLRKAVEVFCQGKDS